jgi:transcriptional regulator with XRE-family HTH domain
MTATVPTGPAVKAPTFAKLLKGLLKERDLTTYALAKRSGLTRQAVGYLLAGDREPSWSTVRRLARVLGVTVLAFDVGEPEGLPSADEGAPGKRGPKGPRKRKKGG